jgi:hypothetical protein
VAHSSGTRATAVAYGKNHRQVLETRSPEPQTLTPNPKPAGVMTIGKFGDPNPEPYFQLLKECRTQVLYDVCVMMCASWCVRLCTLAGRGVLGRVRA